MQLRDNQKKTIEELRRLIKTGSKRPLIVAPCGFGKTVVFCEIIKLFLGKSSASLAMLLVHREELLDQAREELDSLGIVSGVIKADRETDSSQRVQVASIQTLARRGRECLPNADLIIVDEAHFFLSMTWLEVLKLYENKIVIGFTATPFRSDKIKLGDFFDSIYVAAYTDELIKAGQLAPYKAYGFYVPDVSEVRINKDEFVESDLKKIYENKDIIGNVVKEYIKHVYGKRAIVFPPNVNFSKKIVEEFNNAGIAARHIDWSTKREVRREAFRLFALGEVLVLSSVNVLAVGFNRPEAEVAILCKITNSLPNLIQCVGRVLRTCKGKEYALIHDHAGNLLRLGMPDERFDYSLEGTSPSVSERNLCTDCLRIAANWTDTGCCPFCGSVQKEVRAQQLTKPKRKEYIELDGERIPIAVVDKIRALFAQGDIKRKLTDEECIKISRATKQEKIAEYLRLCNIRKEKGYKKGFVGNRYRFTFGVWPKFKKEELKDAKPAIKPFGKV